jgi:DNA-binding NarL/FixJ family response regulator
VPIVVVTALDSPEVAREAMRSGAENYLVKGRFDAARLERALVGAVAPRRPRGEKAAQPELKGEFLFPDLTATPSRTEGRVCLARSAVAG